MSINRAIIMGHVGRDPDIRRAGNGDIIANFSIATSEQWTDKATGEKKEATEWHNIVVFNQAVAGIVEKFVRKGARVAVEGMIKTRDYTDRDGVKRRATEIVIGRFDGRLSLEGKPSGAQRDERGYGKVETREANAYAERKAGAPAKPDLDDDIPF